MRNRSTRSNKSRKARWFRRRVIGAALAVAVTIIGISFLIAEIGGKVASPPSSLANGVVFTDLDSQMREFIAFNRTIALTPEQEAIKKAALERRRAVCCDDYTAYTCCCNCNLSKSLWGLSNYLIAVKGMDPDQVAEAAGRWIEFSNPNGFTGNACYTGGCDRAPRANGCGGMEENDVVALKMARDGRA